MIRTVERFLGQMFTTSGVKRIQKSNLSESKDMLLKSYFSEMKSHPYKLYLNQSLKVSDIKSTYVSKVQVKVIYSIFTCVYIIYYNILYYELADIQHLPDNCNQGFFPILSIRSIFQIDSKIC